MSRESIPGWDPVAEVYQEWIKARPREGAVVVEVGVALGKSITWLADWAIDSHREDVEIWAVDSWCHNAPNGEQQTMAAAAGGDFTLYAQTMLSCDPRAFELIRPVRAPSERAARMFECGSVDLVVIDADHSYEGCATDISVWLPKLRAGGWMGGDDHHEVHHPGVIRACQEAFGKDYQVIEGAMGWAGGRVWIKRLP